MGLHPWYANSNSRAKASCLKSGSGTRPDPNWVPDFQMWRQAAAALAAGPPTHARSQERRPPPPPPPPTRRWRVRCVRAIGRKPKQRSPAVWVWAAFLITSIFTTETASQTGLADSASFGSSQIAVDTAEADDSILNYCTVVCQRCANAGHQYPPCISGSF